MKINVRNEQEKKDWLAKSKSIIDQYGYKSLVNRYHSRNSLFMNMLLILVFALPAFVGLMINAIPFFGGRLIANVTAKKINFLYVHLVNRIYNISFLNLIIALFICCVIFGWFGLLILLGVPLFSMSMIWLDRWNEFQSQLSLGKKGK